MQELGLLEKMANPENPIDALPRVGGVFQATYFVRGHYKSKTSRITFVALTRVRTRMRLVQSSQKYAEYQDAKRFRLSECHLL